jgi:glycyl-tRNA synthetase beta chain
VLATGITIPLALHGRMKAMLSLTSDENFADLRATFKRVMGLTKDHDSSEYESSALFEHSEKELHQHYVSVRDRAQEAMTRQAYFEALSALGELKPSVDALFDSVMVMDKDEAIRHNRLGILKSIANQFHQIADFTKLSAEG